MALSQANRTIANAEIRADRADSLAESARSKSGIADTLATSLETQLKSAERIVQDATNQSDVAAILKSDPEIIRAAVEGLTAVPDGTVIALDGGKCPTGWVGFDDASGRVIIGAGQGIGLTGRGFRETDGAEMHILKESEMPAHNHPGSKTDLQYYFWVETSGQNAGQGGDVKFLATGPIDIAVAAQGGGKPHNNMPPFIALTYCKKGAG